jgi:hypothetical protein
MGNWGSLLKAGLLIFVIPAAILIINAFQDYADDEMTLSPIKQIIMDAWPFFLIGLFIIGIFKIIGRFNNKD